MAVHVGELIADIRSADSEQAAAAGDGRPGGGRTTEDVVREAAGRIAWIKSRTAATDFDD